MKILPPRITRRDFLDGVALAIGAAAVGTARAGETQTVATQDAAGYYPPLLQGLRGSHPGSFEAAHALRDGAAQPPARSLAEHYDLIIVGAGISGLSAAHFYRQRSAHGGRILILDNHDDFGGHAKRNEFDLAGRTALMNGGTYLIDSPRPYGPIAADLLRDLGIDVEGMARRIQAPDFYARRGLGTGVFFDRETFGADTLLADMGKPDWTQWLARAPLSAKARADIAQIESGQTDYLPGLDSEQKKEHLARISYRDFLAGVVKADPAVIAYYQQRTQGEWSVGIDGVSALDCWGIGLPGFQGMALAHGSTPHMGYTAAGYADTGGSTRLHFPDGNATIARLLVRNLIPAALPGTGVERVVMTRADYAALDRPDQPVRLRLNSTATGVRNQRGDAGVEVVYQRGGRAYRVTGGHCILACYNMIIPYLVPELPAEQRAALHSLVKEPLVYVSVALRNWRAFERLGVANIVLPGGYFNSLHLNEHVTVGGYHSPESPEDPVLLHLTRTPCRPGLGYQEQNRAGRAEILATPFATYERKIREQLDRALAAGGFDAARDITGITVNRWPHGYAREYNPLFDAPLPPERQPHVIGRRRFGRISIANSDAGAAAYTDSAIDQAHRAVNEILSA